MAESGILSGASTPAVYPGRPPAPQACIVIGYGRNKINGGAAVAERAGRVREPSPLIPWRLPSGRGATEQPNATGDGDAPLTPRFWVMLVITGVVTGLFADLMMLLLFT